MSETYERSSFFWAYAKWHYGQGLRELFRVAGNFLWFISHFFSFRLLSKTLFSPWKRLGENYEGGFNLSAFASALVVNTLMRVVGFVTRMAVLLSGFVSYILAAIFSFFIFVIWILGPIVLIGSLLLSVAFFVI
ncbi:hypothetical protein M1307_02025 [Patescibacteria group bacterium]|nr:hypothetical protein [Patescibacteria group bacterium]